MDKIYKKRKLRAYLFVFLMAFSSYLFSFVPPFSTLAISPLIIAIIFGVLVGNTIYSSVSFLERSGVIKVATKEILRLGIILYGFKITLDEIASVGVSGVFMAFFIVFSTFTIGCFVGKKLGLSMEESILVSSGSSICGAAAVLATKSVIDAKNDSVAVAVTTVVVFGTFAMFLYPILFKLGVLGLSLEQMGCFLGLSLHEVAHAVGAGAAVGMTDLAVLMKMLRVLMLVPFLFILGFLVAKFNKKESGKKGSITVPWFAIWFLVAVFVGSFLPAEFRNESFLPVIKFLSAILLSMAMFALGITIRKDMLKKAGKKPFILASTLFIWLFTASYTLAYFFI